MISDALFPSSTLDTTYLSNSFRYLHLNALIFPALRCCKRDVRSVSGWHGVLSRNKTNFLFSNFSWQSILVKTTSMIFGIIHAFEQSNERYSVNLV